MNAVDLFAGMGGWDQSLGKDILGIEWLNEAIATRNAAGLYSVQADVSKILPEHFNSSDLLIASPPCQGFSTAGLQDPNDPRNVLVYEPIRWISRWKPKYIAFEQVPPVLPIWKWYQEWLVSLGYSCWVGMLNSEQYGVPQTRKRAILMASTEKEVSPPTPTHSKYYSRTPDKLDEGVLPWISMYSALGWEGDEIIRTRGERQTPGGNLFKSDRVSWTVTSKARSWVKERPSPTIVTTRRSETGIIVGRQLPGPAPTLALSGSTSPIGGSGNKAAWMKRGWNPQDSGVKISLEEALILQSFRPDYPVQGVKTKKFLQVGNSIPPFLANAILTELLK